MRHRVLAFLGVLACTAFAQAASFNVYVGYADDLRPSPFFPTPWNGSPNTIYVGSPSNIDAGAILIQNSSGGNITFNNLVVDGFGDGASFAIWGASAGTVIANGWNMILTQTVPYNFDSSDDQGGNPAAIPMVHLTIDGVTYTYADTAQVLNTEGTDHLAQAGLNESHQWRLIGTTAGQEGTGVNAVPLPSSAWAGLALFGALTLTKVKRATRTA